MLIYKFTQLVVVNICPQREKLYPKIIDNFVLVNTKKAKIQQIS